MASQRLATPPADPGSSGDIIADKRYAYGEACAAAGDFAAAADLFGQAADAAPGWAAAFLARGSALERLGDAVGARAAFAAAAARDPTDRLGAGLHRDRLSGHAPTTLPTAFVEALFDQYAPRFEAHLVDGLGYRGPQIVMAALAALAPARAFGAALDLGCGTGLMAQALAQPGLRIDGIDLSGAMLKRAEATGRYRRLWRGDCATLAESFPAERYDLAIAADVLVYLGDLRSLFRAVARVLVPGGLFVATAQTHAGTGFTLGTDLRFRHAPASLRDTLDAAGLEVLAMADAAVRREGGLDVPGLVFTARRP